MRFRVLILPILVLAAGCAGNQSDERPDPSFAGAERGSDSNPDSRRFAKEVTGGLVSIEWTGLSIAQLIHGIALATGRVFVFDRRQVESKPPVSLSRPYDIPVEKLYPMFELVLAASGLACVPRTKPISGVRTCELLRVVPREVPTGHSPCVADPDLFSPDDIPYLVIAGPAQSAGLVRVALVRSAREAGVPMESPASDTVRLEFTRACDTWFSRSGRQLPYARLLQRWLGDHPGAEHDPNWCDLFRLRSPFPQLLR